MTGYEIKRHVQHLRKTLRRFRPGDQRYIYFHHEDMEALAEILSAVTVLNKERERLERNARLDAVLIVRLKNKLTSLGEACDL